jgi:hypothetical protein
MSVFTARTWHFSALMSFFVFLISLIVPMSSAFSQSSKQAVGSYVGS